MATFLLDTNILLSLANTSSPQHPAAASAVERIIETGGSAVLAAQVIFEFWSVATRPAAANGLGWTVSQVHRALARFREEFSALHDPPEVVDIWLDLVVSYDLKGKRIHDAHLLATMKAHGVSRLLTFNTTDFPATPEFTILHPAAVLS